MANVSNATTALSDDRQHSSGNDRDDPMNIVNRLSPGWLIIGLLVALAWNHVSGQRQLFMVYLSVAACCYRFMLSALYWHRVSRDPAFAFEEGRVYVSVAMDYAIAILWSLMWPLLGMVTPVFGYTDSGWIFHWSRWYYTRDDLDLFQTVNQEV